MRRGLALVLALALTATVVSGQVWQPGASHVETRLPAPEGHDRSRPAWPIAARLSHATDRYDHDVLGGIPPWGVLEVDARACGACRHGTEGASVTLPKDMVFEDVAPRLWDVTGDGRPEIVVVETHIAKGARLAVWSYSDIGADLSRLAETGFIGTRHRWLAPVGAGDFDGDGRIEIAYVDRPHLARELVFVRLEGGRLREIARAPGFSAHRIGDTTITAAVRICSDDRAEVLLPDADWTRILAVSMSEGRINVRDLGKLSAARLVRAATEACD